MIKKLLNTIFLTFLFISTAVTNSHAQILINQADMPLVNDTFRLSNGIPNPLMDPSVTGANHTWDYSWMVPFSQTIDTFKNVSSTGPLYAFFFVNNGSNVNRANLATKGPEFPSVPGVSITNTVGFIYNSTASFKQVGLGVNLNGNNIPIAYGPHDIIYKFPMNYGNIDSSNSAFSLAVPGMGYYGYTLKRNNEVDGWGTLTTPFGTFQTLRVKSTMIQKDTLYVDSLSFGFAMDRPLTVEYKWLADNMGVPVLTVITQDGFGGPVVTSMTYRDSARQIATGTNDTETAQAVISLFPNPGNGMSALEINNNQEADLDVQIINIQGKELHKYSRSNYPSGTSRLMIDSNSLGLSSGIYFINVKIGKTVQTLKWVITSSN